MYRIGIIDDSREFRTRLREMIESQPGGFEVQDFPDAESLLRAGKFDAAFVDIRLEKGSGIDGARRINAEQPGCRIVFCTGYPEMSPDVYVTRHELLITKSRLEELVPVALRRVCAGDAPRTPPLLAVSRRGAVSLVPVGEILYIERKGRTSTVYLESGVALSTSKKLAELHGEVGLERFERCHVSYLVQLSKVTRVGKDLVTLEDGRQLPLSRAYARGFRAAVSRHIAGRADARKPVQ